jgi:hypothetical protein
MLINTNRFRQVIEILGISAIVLSLLLVAYQIRQANRIAEATTTYEIVRDVNQFNEIGMTDPTFAALLVRLGSEEFSPTAHEAKQAQLLAYRFLNIWIAQEEVYRNGLFTEDQLSITKHDVKAVMKAYPALLLYWSVAIDSQPDFAEYTVLQPLIH